MKYGRQPPRLTASRKGRGQESSGTKVAGKMRGCLLVGVLSIFLFLSLPQQTMPATRVKNNCIQCHEFIGSEMGKPVSQWYGSIHQTQGINCDQCHGGNPDLEIGDLKSLSQQEIRTLSKRAMYSVPSFVGAPTGQAQFDLCAKCHPESTKIYASSIMGQAYLQGTGGPSCTRCHGPHRNIIPRVPESCRSCHRDTTGFDQFQVMNITGAQVRELAQLRVQIAEGKVAGGRPLFKGHLESFQTGIIVWGLVLLLFLSAVGLYRLMERSKK
jgi:hypothetical protein